MRYLTSPVVNTTGLNGAWDFDLKWTGRGMLAAAGADGISIFDAVDRELGLKLELQKTPTPVIVVDSATEKPTPNPPGVTTALPPAAPAEFEVADIRPSAPGSNDRGNGFMPGGPGTSGIPMFQATCQNMTMALFAEQLQNLAPLYLTYGVTNATGIEGAFDFTFTYTFAPPAMINQMGGGGREGDRKGAGPAPGGGEHRAASSKPLIEGVSGHWNRKPSSFR